MSTVWNGATDHESLITTALNLFVKKNSASGIEKPLDRESDLDTNRMRKLNSDSQRPGHRPLKFLEKNSASTVTLLNSSLQCQYCNLLFTLVDWSYL